MLVAAILAAALSGDAPQLTVRPAPANPKPGGVVVLEIESDRPLRTLAAVESPKGFWLEPGPDASRYRALLGVDLEREPGPFRLTLQGVAAAGRPFTFAYSIRVAAGHFAVEPLKVDPGYVEPPPSVAERIEAERVRLDRVWKTGDRERRWTGPFRMPLEKTAAHDNFGARRILNGQKRAPHSGVDFSAPVGTPVEAPAPGRVALAEELYFSGGTVILDHGGGLFTSYFHLSKIDVAAGDVVEPGRRLGAVGATGRVTGPHLHWSAKLAGARINPLSLRRLPEWPLVPSP
jgi:murein DD-endopeptidase MepM/ murein hydrolase activator NlpD